MKKRTVILTVLAFAMIISASIQPAIAYFTTYTSALGGHKIILGNTTTITETFSQFVKHIVIHSDEDSEPVYIRAKVFYIGPYTIEIGGTGWSGPDSDNYYYYGDIVNGGGETTELTVAITGIPGQEEGSTEEPEDGENFNVIVVYESVPVQYKGTDPVPAVDLWAQINKEGGN